MSDTSNAIYSHKKFKKASQGCFGDSHGSTRDVSSNLSVKQEFVCMHTAPKISCLEAYDPARDQTRSFGLDNARSTNAHVDPTGSPRRSSIYKPKFQADHSSNDADLESPARCKNYLVESECEYEQPHKKLSVQSSADATSDQKHCKRAIWKNSSSQEVSQHIADLIDRNTAIIEYNKPSRLTKLKRNSITGHGPDPRVIRTNSHLKIISCDKNPCSSDLTESDVTINPFRNESLNCDERMAGTSTPDKETAKAFPKMVLVNPELSNSNHIQEGAAIRFDMPPHSTRRTSDLSSHSVLSHKKHIVPLNVSRDCDDVMRPESTQLSCITSTKSNNHHIYGGEVKIYGNGCKTLIIDSAKPNAPSLDLCIAAQQLKSSLRPSEIEIPTSVVETFAQSGLNSGGTMLKLGTKPKECLTDSYGCVPYMDNGSAPYLNASRYQGRKAVNTSTQHNKMCFEFPMSTPSINVDYVPGMPGPYSEALSAPTHTPVTFGPSVTDTVSSADVRTKDPMQISSFPSSVALDGTTHVPIPRPKSLQLDSHANVASTSLIGSTLISPDTPRPRKSCGQHLLNGAAYTYLNMKVSTKTFYCSIYRPQPVYALQPANSKLSMYSNWQIRKSKDHSNISPIEAMRLHQSHNHTDKSYTIAKQSSMDLIITPSSYWSQKQAATKIPPDRSDLQTDTTDTTAHDLPGLLSNAVESRGCSTSAETSSLQPQNQCDKSAEPMDLQNYTRGRGQGRFVCDTCGIRCRKPSMLKKHIRTHSDVRPYFCKHCLFSFKTKGNLTKHLKSKAHFKKCSSLNISLIPVMHEECDDMENNLQEQSQYAAKDEPSDGDDLVCTEDEQDDIDLCLPTPDYTRSTNQGKSSICSVPSIEHMVCLTEKHNKPVSLEDLPIDLSMKTSQSSVDTIDVVPEEPVLPAIYKPSELLKTIYTTSMKVPASDGTLLQKNIAHLNGDSAEMLQKYLKELAVLDISNKRRHSTKLKMKSETHRTESTSNASKPYQKVFDKYTSDKDQHVPTSPTSIPSLPANITVINAIGEDDGISFVSPNGQIHATRNSSHFDELASKDGKCVCSVCHKKFSKGSQLSLHMNIHFIERPHRCNSCGISFRAKGHLIKHRRSVSHSNKVSINSTFGTPSTDNPRPFKCDDCKVAFRIHGHLAKHLRSKLHVMKLECLGKLPFGIYAEIERSGVSLQDIDTTDCDNSLEGFLALAASIFSKSTNTLSWGNEEEMKKVSVTDDSCCSSLAESNKEVDLQCKSKDDRMDTDVLTFQTQ